ncbi:hypothetical protein AB0M45_22165 [Nocardia sp. NPDC051787]|uniref:hypothetical protein n=1 Tax=Nocardia sp. NPDC051787 TaxID=3155415 RepID=UPI0034399B30
MVQRCSANCHDLDRVDLGCRRGAQERSSRPKAVAPTKRRTRAGYAFLRTAIDGYSRLAYTEALPDEKSRHPGGNSVEGRHLIMKRNILGGTIVCELTMVAISGTAGHANASWACGGGCEGSYYRQVGTGRYEFRIEDSKKDGYGVMGYIRKKSNGDTEEKYVGGGAGDSMTVVREYSAGYYAFRLCTVDGGDHVKIDCTDWVDVG